jgi:hypothetical protein
MQINQPDCSDERNYLLGYHSDAPGGVNAYREPEK